MKNAVRSEVMLGIETSLLLHIICCKLKMASDFYLCLRQDMMIRDIGPSEHYMYFQDERLEALPEKYGESRGSFFTRCGLA